MAELICPSCERPQEGTDPMCPDCLERYVLRAGTVPIGSEPTAIDSLPAGAGSRAGAGSGGAGAGGAGGAAGSAGAGGSTGGAVPGPRSSCADPDCPSGGVVPAVRCPACRRSAVSASLRFPWGEEPLPVDGRLVIGREGSPLAARLTAYPNVGRRHAQLSLLDGRLVVMDLNSVNGTFVNEERVPAMRPQVLEDGDTVRFAAALAATVHLGRTR